MEPRRRQVLESASAAWGLLPVRQARIQSKKFWKGLHTNVDWFSGVIYCSKLMEQKYKI
jgi:hypothetical protein